MNSLTSRSKMDYKKKPWKKYLNFSKAIRSIFSGCISFSLTPSSSSRSSEPNSANPPIRSRHECPCGYHSRQREAHRRQLEAASCTQNHQKLVEEFHVHGRGAEEGNSTRILLISDGNEYEYNDKDEENELSMNDAYALASGWSQGDAAALEDVDKRAEKFIKEFREQLRIQRVLSSEKECNTHTS